MAKLGEERAKCHNQNAGVIVSPGGCFRFLISYYISNPEHFKCDCSQKLKAYFEVFDPHPVKN